MTLKHNYFFSLIILLGFSINGWSQEPPKLENNTPDRPYCPLENIPILTNFNILNPEGVEIKTFYIQISEGYERNEDFLTLTGTHSNITAQPFNSLEGKLELKWTGTGTPSDSEFVEAVKAVNFYTNSNLSEGERKFSITFGEANYLPSTKHYYQYVADLGITWTQAKAAAEALPLYYGVLQGYLATITSTEEAVLSGEQAPGAGWIGGSDAAVEGTWRWVTGPENGKSFWLGDGNGTTVGTDIPFAYWNSGNGEPNNLGNEDYAHVTAPGIGLPGSWNDLTNTGGSSGDYQPKGYIVEYGGMPGEDDLDISTSTRIYIPKVDSTLTPADICGSGSATFEATSSTGTILWFDAETGGTKLGSGDNYTTNIDTSTTYYALASSDGICETGKREPITVTVNQIPIITPGPNEMICESGTTTLTATASEGTVKWYDALIDGNFLFEGNSYTPALINDTTIFYAEALSSNNCVSNIREAITITVQHTSEPIANSPQTFCDVENATLASLIITGLEIKWYATNSGGVPLAETTLLINNATYFATQTVNTCESPTRLPVNVTVYETVIPLDSSEIPNIEECDTAIDGDDTNGFTIFNLTINNTILLNGKNKDEFTFSYFKNSDYTNVINNPTSFKNTIANKQPIYVRIENKTDTSCKTDISFEIIVNSLPEIENTVTLKNCDEDGNPDGKTDFNLTEADPIITKGDNSLTVSYYSTFTEAENGTTPPLNPSPFNNADAINNKVYARIQTPSECYRISTVTLDVSTTSFPPGYMYHLYSCDDDDTIDGKATFDLSEASEDIINQFPVGQKLSVHYYKNQTDAQLSENEIIPQENYRNESPFSENIYVRVQSEDNGDCFGVGHHLTLTVTPRPEFEIDETAITCLNLPPIEIEPFNEKDTYTYEWFNEQGKSISKERILTVSKGGIYIAIATSTSTNCISFEQKITVSESNIATITDDDIKVTDDSSNNTITIKTDNLGDGIYEFALNNGSYQDENIFENVDPGIHTVYVNDKNNCGTENILVSVIGYPKFFTPNGDGKNDYWQVLGVNSNFYPSSKIYIFDRFGKLITQVDPTSKGWDGYLNGQLLPRTDYWFTAQLIDAQGNSTEKKGHFSLLQ